MRNVVSFLSLIAVSALASTAATAAPTQRADIEWSNFVATQYGSWGATESALIASEMRAGEPATITWTGLQPGTAVYFAASAYGSDYGPCLEGFDVCLDIERPGIVGKAYADRAGFAVLDFYAPEQLRDGMRLYFQAVAVPQGEAAYTSEVTRLVAGPMSCKDISSGPVCSVYGETYPNRCSATAAGDPIAHPGACW